LQGRGISGNLRSTLERMLETFHLRGDLVA